MERKTSNKPTIQPRYPPAFHWSCKNFLLLLSYFGLILVGSDVFCKHLLCHSYLWTPGLSQYWTPPPMDHPPLEPPKAATKAFQSGGFSGGPSFGTSASFKEAPPSTFNPFIASPVNHYEMVNGNGTNIIPPMSPPNKQINQAANTME